MLTGDESADGADDLLPDIVAGDGGRARSLHNGEVYLWQMLTVDLKLEKNVSNGIGPDA
jgi:hypothetical protein